MIKTNIKRKITMLAVILCALLSSLFFFGCKETPEVVDNRLPKEETKPEIVEEIPKPTIEIDFGDYNESTIPNAVIGKEYKFFTAKAYDAFDVELPIETTLYLFYASENRTLVQINDGKFIPNAYGQYTIEFSAVDQVGNKTVEKYSFDCLEKQELEVTLESGAVGECKVGDPVEVAQFNCANNNGFVDVEITASNDKETIVVEGGKFVPRYVGKYKISYMVKDYCEKASVSYEIDVKIDSTTKFYGQINLNKFYIIGNTYPVPEVDCVSYVTGEPAKVQPQVYVQYEGEVPQLVEDNKLVLSKAGKFRLIYKAVVGNTVAEKVCNGIAVDVGLTSTFDSKNYFYSESNFSIHALNYGYVFKTPEKECKIDFVNPIQSRRLRARLGFNENNNFSTFNMYLEDMENPEIKVKLTVKKIGEQCVLSANGSSIYEKTGINLNSSNEVVVNYDNFSKIFTFGQANIEIKDTINGEEFNGFVSDNMFISFEMQDVVFDSSFTIYSLNNQAMGESIDLSGPEIIFNKYEEGMVEIGDVVTVNRIFIGTVFTDNFKAEYSIIAPNGEYATDINGKVLSPSNASFDQTYQFVATMLGAYRVTFKATTSIFVYGQNIEFTDFGSYAINVTDTEPPMIVIGEVIASTYKVGEKFKMPTVTVTDNSAEEIKATAYIVDTNNVYVDCSSSEYVFKKAGEYQVKFIAMDEQNNVCIRTFDIKVV